MGRDVSVGGKAGHIEHWREGSINYGEEIAKIYGKMD